MRLLIIFIFFATSSFSQIGMGQWRFHMSSKQAIDVVALNDKVFVAFPTGVSEYNYQSKEVTIWDAVNGLSDISVSSLGYDQTNNAIYVGYENGNIDKIKSNKRTNIPAIKLAEIQGQKRINKIVEHDGFVYFATGFSIVKINPLKDEVSETYYPTNGNQGILDITFVGDSIYAITEDKMYTGSIINPALADPAQWTVDSRVGVLSSSVSQYTEIESVNDSLYVLLKVDGYGLDTIFQISNNAMNVVLQQSFSAEINSIKKVNGDLAVNYFPGTILYDNSLSSVLSINSYSSGAAANLNSIVYQGGVYWLADNDEGLVEYTNNNVNQKILIEGPRNNDFYKMDWLNDKLVVASGGLSGVSSTYKTSGVHIFEDEKWTSKNPNDLNKWQNQNIWDYLSVSINPKNEDIIAVSTYSEIPLSIVSVSGGVIDTFTVQNSLIEGINSTTDNSLISKVEYDENGNLWMLNGYSVNPLKVYTADNEWYEFPLNNSVASKFSFDMVIDYNGNKWMSFRNAGLFGYNDNGTISNTSDDKTVYLNTGGFSGALPSNQVNAMAVDFDNEIWIGTDNGFAVLYNSEGAFDASSGDYNAQRIKVEFEGNVEYVLGATTITDIIVDGANRKWFATDNSGIILLSPDGLEVLEHHTMDNSPIISNNILDLELDHNTGELYIITDLGLVSYRTDATYEDPDYENVVVFPNPARPDFDGPITIQGIRYNSDVKITDVAGKVVYKTTSNGGTATWDGKNLNGERVQTGVYLIWTAANEGKGRKVGKIAVVN